jgi:ferredoxin, 2Fe-2S
MPHITLIEHDGTRHSIVAKAGQSLMHAARENDIPGIDGECGGGCSCATCHVFIDKDWLAITGSADGTEQALIEFLDDSDQSSRLSCQVEIVDEMDGLIVRIPESQL